MANEFKHKDPGSELTQAEFIAACGDGHIFACQATGDIVYASSATVLSKLARGAANTVLSMGGSCIPAWTASPSVTDLTIGGGCITLTGAATDIDLIDNNASALSFDASGKTGIIDIVTTNCSEGVTMSGTLGVTGVLTATGGIELSHACQNTLTGSGGVLSIQGNRIFHAGGTDVPVADGGTGASCLTDGGVLLGSGTDAVTAMAVLADGEMIVGDGTTDPVAESGATLRTSIGVGTGNSPPFTGIELSHATANTLTASCGVLSIECNRIFHAGGTDFPVADGGTGASTFTANGILVGNGTSAIAVTATMATKGHLMVGDGSGVPSMLAVGNNCLVLTACSSEGTGVKWAAAGGGLNSCADAIINNGYGIVLGNSAQLVAGDNPGNVVAEFQMVGTGSADTSMHLIAHSADAEPAIIRFAKSRNATIGSHTAVQACDIIGSIDYFGCDGGDMQPYAARIMVKVDGSPCTNDMPGRIEFHTTADGAQSATNAVTINSSQQVLHVNGSAALPSVGFSGDVDTGSFLVSAGNIGWSIGGSEAMRLNSNKGLFINETVDGKSGAGAIVANQDAADDPQLILKSSDVAHGMTDQMETDSYFAIRKASACNGGAMFEAASQGCVVICGQLYGSVDCSTRSTSGKAHMQFKMYGRTGTGVTVKGTGSNAFAISHAGNMRFVVDVCGNVYYDGTTNASNWDEHCDVSLLTATRAITMPEDADFKHRFSSFIDEYACALEATGVVTLNRDTDNIPFVNTKALNGLIIDSIRQVHEKVIGLENQFKALQGGCP